MAEEKKRGGPISFKDLGLSTTTLDFQLIKNNNLYPAFVGKLVEEIEEKCVMLLGPWLRDLPYLDFMALESAFDFVTESPEDYLPTLDELNSITGVAIIVTELLALAEGLSSPDEYHFKSERMELLNYFVSVESMRRKGLPMEIYYEKMSLDNVPSETNDPPIVARLVPNID